ncbi:hypothetical protein [Pedobacter sp. KLB.chiD]|uniref:hypothetical protein n=1 Tax=Pedobacter sp. KLB.chiD TaxID=3387402 RepID=UPI00399A066F
MRTSNSSVTSIEKAKQLHTQFPHEVHEFFSYLKLYITYNGLDNLIQKRLMNYLDQYQEQMDSDALTFAYMLFQPSSARFVEHCILSYATHSDSSTHFVDYVKANYL